jgi:Papain family cysteine protease
MLEPRVALNAGPATRSPEVNLSKVFTDARFNTIPYDQVFSDCVANAVAADIDYNLLINDAGRKLITAGFRPSRLFLYYDSRFLGFDKNTDRSQKEPFTDDTGTLAQAMLQSAATQGIATEGKSRTHFPYPAQNQPTLLAQNPGAANYLAARTVRITGFQEFSKNEITPAYIKTQLKARKPVLIGMSLPTTKVGTKVVRATDSDELIGGGPDGLPTIPPPGNTYKPGDDGHELLVVGYNKNAVIVLNSWGSNWGKNGYAYLPDVYLKPQWVGDADTISGISISTATAPSIGKLSQLNSRPFIDRTKGQIDIDTQPPSAAGTATSFDFYSRTNGSQYVTPLLFNFNAASQTYTLAGIGASFKPQASPKGANGEQQGIPFVARFGNANVTSTSRLGFYDGDVTSAGKQEIAKANLGMIPYSSRASGLPAWLSSTGMVEPGDLKIGMTFASTARANVALTGTASRTYSAMLNE